MTISPHYQVDGPARGQTVVLSGSLGSDLRMWQPQVAPLVSAGYRVVRVDHRGHGGSPAPAGPYTMDDLGNDFVALLDRLGEERVHWVGLSLGGMVGMWLGSHAPDRIAGLTLCCTSAGLPPEPWAERARLVRAKGTDAVADAVVSRWVTPAFAAANQELVSWLRAMIVDTSDEGYASCCTAIETMDLAGTPASISSPTLVIAGEQDPATPPEHGRRIADEIPGARLEVIAPAAHLANVEQPERISRLIIEQVRKAS